MEAIPKSDIKSDVTFDISMKRTTWIGHREVRQTPKKWQLKNGHFTTTSGHSLQAACLAFTKLRFRRSF